ncbi:hypothetical protein C8F01DRAFT_1380690, partial [Mycena amicta]
MVSWGLSRSIDRVALIPGCRCISWTFARLICLPLGFSGRRYISSSFALGSSSSALLFPGVARLSRVCPRLTPFPCPAGRTLLHLFPLNSALIASSRVLPHKFPCACSNPAAGSFVSATTERSCIRANIAIASGSRGCAGGGLVGRGLYP